MEVDRDRAREAAAAGLQAHGIGADDASLVAEVLVTADARGKASHGLLRLPRIIRGIESGNVDPEGTIDVVAERGGVARVSGGHRLGPAVATEAVAEVTDRAAEFGIGAVGVQESNHLGMLGYYTDQLRREGYVGLAVTNTEPAMPPHGGAEAILGTNPIAIGLPTDPPFNLDMATSAISRGDILHSRNRGEEIPEGAALAADGERTTDPAEALEGVVLPIAGPKGSGLAIAVEILAGGLVGAAMGTAVTGTYHTEDPCTKGDLFVALDPAAFGQDDFVARASEFLRDLQNGETAEGFDDIRIPGGRSLALDTTAETVDVDDDLWATIQEFTD